MAKQKIKYDWAPHEVRRDERESRVAYIVVSVAVVVLVVGGMLVVLRGLS
ncbi:hypothetical protein VVD49_19265 [Uliginosibacterium sp. H3]|uniref:Uncharacterized protein n=1 Tax=Uliginosibacterium silvisoli TaxID=3114758 RepID=A0ABU6K8Z1_9RHOO|nr:hypothetical protein [Uliginosibacterium sp. H3]